MDTQRPTDSASTRNGLGPIGSFALLTVAVFALFMIVVASVELWKVAEVRAWPEEPARIVSVEREPSPYRPGATVLVHRLVLERTGEVVRVTDVRPGDFPFSLPGWSPTDLDTARKSATSAVVVVRAPDGSRVYLERGDPTLMTVLLLASLGFWGAIVLRLLRRRRG